VFEYVVVIAVIAVIGGVVNIVGVVVSAGIKVSSKISYKTSSNRNRLHNNRVAYMLTQAMTAATLVKNARETAQLSIRALAARAELAASTVTRIEAGTVSPSFETVQRLLAVCGQELDMAATPADTPSIATLANAWEPEPSGDTRPDWTRLRNFLDHLALHPEQQKAATVHKPPPSGSPVMDNLLAAVAETIDDAAGYRPHPWTKEVEPLDCEWSLPGTPLMKEARKASTPARFARRGLIVDEESLWREPISIDA
jgi:transcriptional regulator with XRE-family HTH domain